MHQMNPPGPNTQHNKPVSEKDMSTLTHVSQAFHPFTGCKYRCTNESYCVYCVCDICAFCSEFMCCVQSGDYHYKKDRRPSEL